MAPSPDPQARFLLSRDGLAASLGILVPEVLLPRPGLDLSRWAVVACDQYTAEPAYWDAVESLVGEVPSTLRLVLPEIRLEREGPEEVERRIEGIGRSMEAYLADGVLRSAGTCAVLVERSTPLHPSRWGLVLAVDLERYDFAPGSRALVRATEGTVLSRLPPRARIRRDAPLELPHVQLLFDDPARSVIPPLAALAAAGRLEPLYDADLMMGGGAVRGYRVDGASPELREALRALSRLRSLSEDGLLFAVGDGNHSLAAAKRHWESVREGLPSGSDPTAHPARYALVEAVDLNDPGLEFEPIHRIVYGVGLDELEKAALDRFAGQGPVVRGFDDADQAVRFARGCDPATHPVPMLAGGRGAVLLLDRPAASLAVASVQGFLDALAAERPFRIDYIHGEDVVLRLSREEGTALLLPPIAKASLFPRIASEGILPRKAFSMGESFEKRYYMESRRIR